MTKLYKVNGQRGGGKVRFSVDEVDQAGKFICQAAFFFKTRHDAQKRMAEMIAEDAAEAPMSFFRDGKCVANVERKSNTELGIVASAAWQAVANG